MGEIGDKDAEGIGFPPHPSSPPRGEAFGLYEEGIIVKYQFG
jgi:hypothetical protein